MASDEKKAKTKAAPKKEPSAESTKKEAPAESKSTADADVPKAEGAESVADQPSGYSRGEGQKPVSKASKDNWNTIFAKKKKKR